MRFTTAKLLLLGLFILCCSGTALADLELTIHDMVQTGGDFASLLMDFEVYNPGPGRDNVYLAKEDFLPEWWSTSICVGEQCWGPDVMEANFSINEGETVTFGVHLNIFNQHDSGYCNFSISSDNAPALDETIIMAGMHEDCEILVVDDGARGHSSIEDVLRGVGNAHEIAYWPRLQEAPTLAELQDFEMVFWLTGEIFPGLDVDDRALLESYLAADGKLLLSGEALAYDICDPASPNYSTEAHDWFEDILSLEYQGKASGQDVTGLAGDYLGDGFAISMSDGDSECDMVEMLGIAPGARSFTYDAEGKAAAITRGGDAPLIYLGFGLEDCGADISPLIDRAYDIFSAPNAVADADGIAPARLSILCNYPNPFNPKTSLRFVAPGAGLAKVEILDPQGRVVDTFSARVEAGVNNVTFLADELGSGVYLYRISLDGESSSAKMTLVK